MLGDPIVPTATHTRIEKRMRTREIKRELRSHARRWHQIKHRKLAFSPQYVRVVFTDLRIRRTTFFSSFATGVK